MFTVQSILPNLQRALGACDTDEILNRVNSAVEILSTETLWDPLRGFVDICVGCRDTVTLPPDVESISAVNIAGRPAQGHDVWWTFHLNGPGDKRHATVDFDWIDGFTWPTYDDIRTPSPIVAQLYSATDDNAVLRVYGYDDKGFEIFSVENGVTVPGFLVPTTFGTSVPNPDAPLVSRITRVSKAKTAGYIRLATLDYDPATGAGSLLGFYSPVETEPQYRRIRLSRTCTWARVAYRKKTAEITDLSDLIPLHSTQAVVLMCQALKKFDNDRLKEGQEYWQTAVELLKKKQLAISPPTGPSIQIADRNLIANKNDRLE